MEGVERVALAEVVDRVHAVTEAEGVFNEALALLQPDPLRTLG